MANLNVIYRIAADISGLQQGVDKVAAVTERLESMAKRAGLAFASAFSVQQIAAFVQQTTKSFAEEEAASNRLLTALKAQGTFTPILVGHYKDLATQFQKTTAFSDDLILEMEALLTQVGDVMPAQMGAALKAATDLAAGLGIDLRAATLLVGKAFAGETGTLKRYGIVIDETKLKTDGVAAVMEGINAKFGGQAQAQVEGYAGKMQQFSNVADDARERVGELLAGGLKPLQELFIRLPEPLQTTGVVLQGLTPNLQTMALAVLSLGGPGKAIPLLTRALGLLWPVVAVGATAFAAWKIGTVIGEFTGLTDKVEYLSLRLQGFSAEESNAAIAIRKQLEASTAAAEALQAQSGGVEVLTDQLGASETALRLTTDQQKASTKATADDTAEKARNLAAVHALEFATTQLTGSIAVWQFQLEDTGREMVDVRLKVLELERSATVGIGNIGQAAEDMGEQVQKGFKRFTDGASLGTAISDTIIGALQGGGSAVASAAAKLGQSLATSISKSFGQSFAGGVAGGLLTSGLTFGLGTLASILMSPTTGSRGTMATRLLGELKEAAGGMEGLRAQARAVGIDLNNIFQARSISEYVTRIEELNEALGNQAVLLEDIQGGLDDLGSAVASNFGIIPAALRPAIEALLRMHDLTEAQRQSLQDMLTGGTVDFEGLTKMAERYGISMEALGPKFQQQEITRKARIVLTDFENLQQAGADMGGVLLGMSDEVSKLVQQAIQYGVALPEALRPILENLLAAGKLVDADGKKIESLAGINFEDSPLQKSTDAIVAAIDRLGELLSGIPGKARKAADGIPENPFKKWKPPGWSMPAMPEVDSAATGGRVTRFGIQRFEGGGVVLPWPMQPRSGGEVPIIAHVGEVIRNQAQEANLSSQMAARSTTVYVGPFYIDGVFSEGDLEQTVRRQMVPIIARTIEDNVGGARTRFQEALG